MKSNPPAVPPAPTFTDPDLRRRAEEALQSQATPATALTTQEMQKLLYELQIHQIELKMRNEELCDARLDSETALHL